VFAGSIVYLLLHHYTLPAALAAATAAEASATRGREGRHRCARRREEPRKRG